MKKKLFFFGPILLCTTHQMTIWCRLSGDGAWEEKMVPSHSQQGTLWTLTGSPTNQTNLNYLPGGSDGKDLAHKARHQVSSLGWEDRLEKGMGDSYPL